MTFQLINIPYVKNDIFEITSYYKEISPKLASEFIYHTLRWIFNPAEIRSTKLIFLLKFHFDYTVN